MTKRKGYLIQRLEKSAKKTKTFFKGLSEEQWHVEIYSEGASWRVHQILAHFVSTEQSIARLVKNIVNDSGSLPDDFDVDLFNETAVKKLEGLSHDTLLVRFLEARQEMIAMLTQFSDDDLDKIGRHPWLNAAPVDEMIKLVYRHNQIHQRDIRKAIHA
ncbi:MAG: DinB family protein [Chloroflexota bacterium]